MSYLLLKNIHMGAAVLTISGFILRSIWMMQGSELLQHRVTRIAPHIIDTVFLLAGIALVWLLGLNVFTQPWLLAKFTGLIVYIVLGTIAIKRGPTRQIRITAFVAALAVFAYISGVAMSKSVLSWIAFG
ncbi:MAG: SirB2 family protein [Gammaproteobacteria bacterium]|nr:SirB2 family protein [Gammaproteobacteria bacterium]